jgi:hypothetical protein
MIYLENMCWACDTPIDSTKPSKHYEKDTDGIELKKLEEIEKKR